MRAGPIRISSRILIPAEELHFRFSRSSGPGGQHVNRSATQVELRFDLAGSPSLTADERTRAARALAGYLDQRGTLHLTSQATRSQHRNRLDVIHRFQKLLARALRVPKRRRPTRPSRAAREARLRTKHRLARTKRLRRPPGEAD